METNNAVILEVKKNDKLFMFVLPNGSTYGESFDVAFEILNKLVEMQQDSIKKSQDSYQEVSDAK